MSPSHQADAAAPSGADPRSSPTLRAVTPSQTTGTSDSAQTSNAPKTGDTSTICAECSTATEAATIGGDHASIDTDNGDHLQARLCSRPYSLSKTPGKGALRGEKSPAAYAEAIERLRPGFDVAVDLGERRRWTTKQGVEIDGLDPSKRHTIKISAANGKRVRELVLDFRARGSDDLCLVFNDFDETWQLQKLRTGQRCGPCVTRGDSL